MDRETSKIVYTAVCGDKDPVREDITCFTGYDRFKSDRLNAKIYKVLPHFFLNVDYSIWVDANVYLKRPIDEYIDLLGDKDIAVFTHCERDNIYQEAEFNKKIGKDDPDLIEQQVDDYKKLGVKSEPLGMGFLIIRKHTPGMARACENWWSHICVYSSRDQLSMTPSLGDNVKFIPTQPMTENYYFKRVPHGK